MALKQQEAQKPVRIGLTRDYPDMPEFPVDLSIQSRVAYNAALKDWWYKVKQGQVAQDEDIAAKAEK